MSTVPTYFAPNGKQIIATAERLYAHCKFTGIGVKPDGKLDFEWDGETDINWDTQETVTNRRGQRIFLDTDYKEWPENKLEIRHIPEGELR